METYCLSGNGNGQEFPVHVGVCCIKVFKDKGADRKQKQDQQRMEKMAPSDLVRTKERFLFLSGSICSTSVKSAQF